MSVCYSVLKNVLMFYQTWIVDKPDPRPDHTDIPILGLVNNSITLLMKQLEIPSLSYSAILPLNQHLKKWGLPF